MRAAFFKPGVTEPYAVAHRPVAAPPDGMLLLLGGTLEVTRGDFPAGATLRLSAPPAFVHGDWVRVWLDDDLPEDPIYLGELLGEPWRAGVGEVRARSLMDRVRRCRWMGRASGSLVPFLTAVLALTRLPDGITVAPLPDLPAVFDADTAFELLGDTLNAIEPALGGALFGVDTRGRLALVDPGTGLTHRFPQGMADTPPGATDNYANCVRFSFEYPSSDTGYFEGRNEGQIAAHGGEVWDVSQATVREIGLPEQPYAGLSATLTRTVNPGGAPMLRADGTIGGTLSTVDLTVIPGNISVQWPATMPAPPRPDDESYSNGLVAFAAAEPLAVRVLFGPATKGRLLAAAQAQEEHTTRTVAGITGGYFDADVRGTRLSGVGVGDTFTWSEILADGTLAARKITAGTHTGSLRLEFPQDWNNTMILAYHVPFMYKAADAGRALEPILFARGSRAYFMAQTYQDKTYEQFKGYSASLPTNNPAMLTTSNVRVIGQDGAVTRQAVTLPWPLLSELVDGTEDEYDPMLALIQRSNSLSLDGTAVLDFDPPLALPYGSSLEFEALATDSLVGGLWVLTSASLAPEPALRERLGLPLALLTWVQGQTAAGAVGTVLPAVEPTSDRWLRYAVRGPAGWNKTGAPPDLLLGRLLLTGLKNIGRVRIRTPYVPGLTGYAERLLVYKMQPRREWTGRYRRLRRASVLGRAAFELPRSPDDVVLDVQKATYDLKELTVSLAAGVPEPATDEDAVAEQIGNI